MSLKFTVENVPEKLLPYILEQIAQVTGNIKWNCRTVKVTVEVHQDC